VIVDLYLGKKLFCYKRAFIEVHSDYGIKGAMLGPVILLSAAVTE
jgi:hypothetical protein